jgi:hypothetical protein
MDARMTQAIMPLHSKDCRVGPDGGSDGFSRFEQQLRTETAAGLGFTQQQCSAQDSASRQPHA